jgi:hypothetical protein
MVQLRPALWAMMKIIFVGCFLPYFAPRSPAARSLALTAGCGPPIP